MGRLHFVLHIWQWYKVSSVLLRIPFLPINVSVQVGNDAKFNNEQVKPNLVLFPGFYSAKIYNLKLS